MARGLRSGEEFGTLRKCDASLLRRLRKTARLHRKETQLKYRPISSRYLPLPLTTRVEVNESLMQETNSNNLELLDTLCDASQITLVRQSRRDRSNN